MEKLQTGETITIEKLKIQLEEAGIDVTSWGTGKAKTLENLLVEVEGGETVLETSDDGELLRIVVVGGADLYYKKDGKTYRLTEEKQVFKDGRERRRNFKGAVQEKMKAGENPKEAMIRGIWEELGITDSIELEETEKTDETLDSPSYPGLRSRYIRYNFRGTLSDEQYNVDGYVEEQVDKSTYFVWEEV